jgi:hypothetical protein
LMVCAHPGRNLAERRMDRLEDLHVVGRHSQPGNGKTLSSSSPSGGAAAGRDALPRRATGLGGDQRKTRALIVANSTPAAAHNGRPTRRSDRPRPLMHPFRGPAKRQPK